MKFATLFLAVAVAALPACSKKEDAPKPTTEAPKPTTEAPKETPKEVPPAPTPSADADFISVFAAHAEPKPNDPVEVKFTKFSVTKASFDPKNLEGGTATIAIDLASLDSGSPKRDGHLKSPDYIDLAKFTTATIDVTNVKKKSDTAYTADANVDFHGAKKTYPVEFEVVSTTDDSVKIKGAQKFARADFGLGKGPGPDESVAQELEIKLQLTLKKT
jgi:polyisoprenoid-binding protein YceI